MNNFTLGKYVPYNSFLHRMDPRVKLAMTVCLMVCVFLAYSTWSMTFLVGGILFILAVILLRCTHMGIKDVLKSLRSLWFMLFFLMIIYIVVPRQTHTLPIAWEVGAWVVYWDSFADAGKIMLRLITMMTITMTLTASTKPLDLTYALEWYMTPLKPLHFPAAEIAMTISIALRFIPTLLDDTSRVMKAQASRGVDMEHGKLMQKITGITSLIIPLFVSSFMRSEELANAMECRGYDPTAKRTRYRRLKARFSDFVFLIVANALLAGCIYMCVTSFDVFALFGVTAL